MLATDDAFQTIYFRSGGRARCAARCSSREPPTPGRRPPRGAPGNRRESPTAAFHPRSVYRPRRRRRCCPGRWRWTPSIGWPQITQIGRPAPTTSRVRLEKARAVPTGIRTRSTSAALVSRRPRAIRGRSPPTGVGVGQFPAEGGLGPLPFGPWGSRKPTGFAQLVMKTALSLLPLID